MEQPLGVAAGNVNEVIESVETLKGGGPADLRALTIALAGHPDAARVLASGAAYERFARMVHGHGGRLAELPATGVEEVVVAPREGVVTVCDALAIGRAAFVLGAGRLRAEDAVDPRVGVLVHKKVGDRVGRGEPLATLQHADRGLVRARAEVAGAFRIGDVSAPRPLLIGRVEGVP
jgi:thymidine phosphorylase